jgi:hypothetical protein
MRIEAELKGASARVELLQSLCTREKKPESPHSATIPPPPPEPQPATEDEYRYHRWLTQHMVFALEEVRGTAAEEPVERALFNAGVRHIGVSGEEVPFNSSLHKATEAVAPGDPVTILEPGWLVLDDRGEFTLSKAKVRPASPEFVKEPIQIHTERDHQ